MKPMEFVLEPTGLVSVICGGELTDMYVKEIPVAELIVETANDHLTRNAPCGELRYWRMRKPIPASWPMMVNGAIC